MSVRVNERCTVLWGPRGTHSEGRNEQSKADQDVNMEQSNVKSVLRWRLLKNSGETIPATLPWPLDYEFELAVR